MRRTLRRRQGADAWIALRRRARRERARRGRTRGRVHRRRAGKRGDPEVGRRGGDAGGGRGDERGGRGARARGDAGRTSVRWRVSVVSDRGRDAMDGIERMDHAGQLAEVWGGLRDARGGGRPGGGDARRRTGRSGAVFR